MATTWCFHWILCWHQCSRRYSFGLNLITGYLDCFILLVANKQYPTCWQIPLLLPPSLEWCLVLSCRKVVFLKKWDTALSVVPYSVSNKWWWHHCWFVGWYTRAPFLDDKLVFEKTDFQALVLTEVRSKRSQIMLSFRIRVNWYCGQILGLGITESTSATRSPWILFVCNQKYETI